MKLMKSSAKRTSNKIMINKDNIMTKVLKINNNKNNNKVSNTIKTSNMKASSIKIHFIAKKILIDFMITKLDTINTNNGEPKKRKVMTTLSNTNNLTLKRLKDNLNRSLKIYLRNSRGKVIVMIMRNTNMIIQK